MDTLRTMIIALISTCLLANCSSSRQAPHQAASNFIYKQSVVHTTHETYPAKNPQAVAVYDQERVPHTAYRIIGTASVSKYNLFGMPRQADTMQQMLKKLAASIGGDGIIDISETSDQTHAKVIAYQKILI